MSPVLVDVTPLPGADPQVGLLLSMLDVATQEWREELGAVSPEEIVRQPFPGGHSIGALILHIADVEAFWLHEVATGLCRTPEQRALWLTDETDQDAVSWPTPPLEPLSWYYEVHDDVRRRTRALLSEIHDLEHKGAHKDWEFTLRWLLQHVITHEAYHGGQAVYLALQHKKTT